MSQALIGSQALICGRMSQVANRIIAVITYGRSTALVRIFLRVVRPRLFLKVNRMPYLDAIRIVV
jgi:hypothetical protein